MSFPSTHLEPTTEKLLNEQINKERAAETTYLSMAVWAERNALPGVAKYFFHHAAEEREHMMKIVRYLLELGKQPIIPHATPAPETWKSLSHILTQSLANEIIVTQSIYKMVDHTLAKKDFGTFQFLQWYVAEQREEEATCRRALELIETIGEEGTGRFHIDTAIGQLHDATIA